MSGKRNEPSVFIGIDPGKSGGIAWIILPPEVGFGANSRPVVEAHKMPGTEMDIFDVIAANPFVETSAKPSECSVCLIEKVGGMPHDVPMNSFSFGQNYGALRMALIAAGITFEAVAPGRWQREFGLLARKTESKTEKKNRHKARAQELFPGIKITHSISDALLLAEYCRRKWGKLKT